MIQRRVFVGGRVQGVAFRASLVREAARFPGILGWVRNLADGRVEALLQGDPEAVLALVAWCRRGPTAARVDAIEVCEEKPEAGLAPFAVQR